MGKPMVKVDQDSIDGGNLDGIWPLRLLHVETFTSYEGKGPRKNIYNGHEAPEYNVLSYTWGRWRQDEGPRLPVQGITWTVPSVRPSCFTVQEFKGAIEQAAQSVEFVWVDVLCIDQDEPTIRAFEIGRQAGIFQGAEDYYIWLHDLSSSQLEESMQVVYMCHRQMMDENVQIANPEAAATNRWAAGLHQALTTLLSDNWFSSLWTLQESQLGSIGRLMSREAHVLGRLGTPKACTIYEFSKRLISIHDKLMYHETGKPPSSGPHSALQSLSLLIQKSGLVTGFDSLQLYFAAGNRTALYPEDRIYGIMQVFNLCLGKAAEPEKDFALPELETQFALALHQKSPVMAQLFRHVQPAAEGRAWCVTQTCERPFKHMTELWSGEGCSECSIGRDVEGRVCFNGSFYGVDQMLAIWHETQSSGNTVVGSPTFLLDAGKLADKTPIDGLPQILRTMSEEVKSKYGVLLLGMIPHESVEEEGYYHREAGPEYRYIDVGRSAYVGMMVEQSLMNGQMHWKRLGIVLWPYDTKALQRQRSDQAPQEGTYFLA